MRCPIAPEWLLIFACLLLLPRPAHAAECVPVTINALDQGWYDSSGFHNPANRNYLAGNNVGFGGLTRHWFAFNIPASTQQALSASLRLYTFNIISAQGGETLELRHVATPVGALRLGGSGLTNVYQDLADGPVYGGRSFLTSELHTFATVPLNPAFLTDVNAAAGGTLALGGTVTTLDGMTPPATNEYVFGGSDYFVGNPTNPSVQLILTYESSGPPVFLQQPASAWINYGQSVTLQGQVCGAAPVSYQWIVQNTNWPPVPEHFVLAGATNATLALNNVTTNDTGFYRLVASNALGSTTSAVAQVVVLTEPPWVDIYLAAGSWPYPAGSSVTLCSFTTGVPAPALQWQWHGTNLPGQTASCLTLPNLTSNQSGPYRLVASNLAGRATSEVFNITVNYTAPAGYIYVSSGNNPALAGSSMTFCSAITAGGAASRQWRLYGTNLPGRTASCLSLNNLTTAHAGPYDLVLTNASGAFTSSPVYLTVNHVAPTVGNIVVTGGTAPANAGNSVTLCAWRNGAPAPSGQWRFNDVDLPGQTGDCLTLLNLSSNEAGQYRFFVSNVVGVATSAPFNLVVNYLAPTGSVRVASGTNPTPAGSSVQLCATIAGAPAPTLSWLKNGTNFPGETNGLSCFQLFGVSSNDAALYQVVLSNSVGVFTSAPLALAVSYVPPAVSISPSGVLGVTPLGTIQTFCASLTGAPPPGVQWYFNDTPLAQFGQCLQLNNVQVSQSGSYYAVATNIAGRATSQVAQLTVAPMAPTAHAYLASGTLPVWQGNSLTFCSTASGGPPPTRQWLFQGTNLPGATNSCLVLYNLQPNQAGDYVLVASNSVGMATSGVLRVAVALPAPVRVYFHYGAPVFAVGSPVTMCGAMNIAGPYTVQWRRNGTALPGETNTCLFFPSVNFSDVADYSLVATDLSNSYTSAPVNLPVYIAPPRSASPVIYLGQAQALVGEDLSLSASHEGSPAFIQWRFNGVNLPGQTNQLLTFFGLNTNHAGAYSFTAVNSAGAVTSSFLNVTVGYQAPSWTAQPVPIAVPEGGDARFNARARGGPLPDYYLFVNGTNVPVPYTYETYCCLPPGGFSLLDVSPADTGYYTVVASNFLGSITSAPAPLFVLPAGPLDRWTQRHPLPQSQPLLAVTRGPGQFVAVGERGTIITSADGANWSLQNRRADVALRGVAAGAGVFVAVGDGGTILSSGDGTNWAYRAAAAGAVLYEVIFTNGRFLVIGTAPGAGAITMTSTNGVDWTRLGTGFNFLQKTITTGNGLFVSGGHNYLRVSPDGTNWSTVFAPADEVEGVAYGGGWFVAVGDDGSIAASANGTAWQPRVPVTTRRLSAVTYGVGKFVAVGSRGTILTSTDTVNWTAQFGGTFDRFEAVHFADGLFIATGENGIIITSSNGVNWTQQNLGTTRDLDGLAEANGLAVAVGKGGGIITSTNGVNWTLQTSPLTNDLHGVAFGGGLWVAVGEPGIILTSPDAVNWTHRPTTSTNSLKGLTHANGRWVVVGTQGGVLTSTNGVNWTAQTIYAANTFPIDIWAYDLNDVAFGNGRFLIAGDGFNNQNGSLFTSANGMDWTQVSFYPGKNLRGITFADGRFVLTANDGLVFHGPGTNTFFTQSSAGFVNLRGAAFARGLWTVVGNSGGIYTSPDLSLWTKRASRTFENFHRTAFLGGQMIAIGNRGTVLQSGRFTGEPLTGRWQPGTGFTLGVPGIIGQVYRIETSTNLLEWHPLHEFTSEADTTTFTDPDATSVPFRFYRVIEP